MTKVESILLSGALLVLVGLLDTVVVLLESDFTEVMVVLEVESEPEPLADELLSLHDQMARAERQSENESIFFIYKFCC